MYSGSTNSCSYDSCRVTKQAYYTSRSQIKSHVRSSYSVQKSGVANKSVQWSFKLRILHFTNRAACQNSWVFHTCERDAR